MTTIKTGQKNIGGWRGGLLLLEFPGCAAAILPNFKPFSTEKYVFRIITLALMGLAILAEKGALADEWPANDPKCAFLNDGGKVLTGSLPRRGKDSLQLRIPKLYLPGPFYPRDGKIGYDGAVLLYAHKDTLQPYPLKEMHGKIAAGKQDWISILIYYRAGLSEVKDIELSIFAKSDDDGKLVPTEDAYGLLSYKIQPRRGGNDVFVHQLKDKIKDVISCNRPPQYSSDGPYPQCRHFTSVSPDTDVDVGYSRVYLPDWQEIKRNVERFVSCVVQY